MLPTELNLAKLKVITAMADDHLESLLEAIIADPTLATHPLICQLKAVIQARERAIAKLQRLRHPHTPHLLVAIRRDGAATQYVYEPFDGIDINFLRHRP